MVALTHTEYMREYRKDPIQRAKHNERERLRNLAKGADPVWAAARRERLRLTRARWRAANPEKSRDQVRQRKLMKAGVADEYVDKQAVFARDGGVCGICRLPIEGDWHLDHVIPLARGGRHRMDNVQPAHPFCNGSKGSKILGVTW